MAAPQTSEHGGFIRGLAAEVDAGGDPVASAFVRDALTNNALHLLDEFGQALVSVTAVTATDLETSASTDLALIPGCDWQVPLRPRHGDASSFRVVVHLRAMISSAGTATFRIALRPPQFGSMLTIEPYDPASFPTAYIAEVSTTSTSGADLAATLYIPTTLVASAPLAEVESENAGGDLTAAYFLTARLQVWAKSSSAGKPQVLALNAREFCGER